MTNSTFLNSFLCNYNRHGIVIKINHCITHLSVLKSQLFSFNFILPANSTCQIDHSTTLHTPAIRCCNKVVELIPAIVSAEIP